MPTVAVGVTTACAMHLSKWIPQFPTQPVKSVCLSLTAVFLLMLPWKNDQVSFQQCGRIWNENPLFPIRASPSSHRVLCGLYWLLITLPSSLNCKISSTATVVFSLVIDPVHKSERKPTPPFEVTQNMGAFRVMCLSSYWLHIIERWPSEWVVSAANFVDWGSEEKIGFSPTWKSRYGEKERLWSKNFKEKKV